MCELPERKTEHLHRGRISLPRARYFITFNTANRQQLLTSIIQQAILLRMEQHQTDGDLTNICATIMPDHVHWLFELGERLPIGRIISKIKRLSPEPIKWQRDFFEHRLRPHEAIELYGRYIFLNPYRAKLLTHDDIYQGTRLWKPEQFNFTQSLTTNEGPQPEWLNQARIDPLEAFERACGTPVPTDPT